MPNSYCVLCGNRDKSFSYYTFPKNKESRKKWLSFCGINEEVLNTATKLCSSHFDKDDIVKKAKGSIVKPDAVPHITVKKRKLDSEKNEVYLDDRITANNGAIIDPKFDSSTNDGKSDGIVSTEIAEETISDTIDKVTDDVFFNKASWKEHSAVISQPSTPSSGRSIRCFQTSEAKRARIFPRYIGDITPSHISTPRRAKRTLDMANRTIVTLRKKIKILHQSRRRVVTRIKTMEELVRHLKEQNLLSDSTAEKLMVITNS